MSLDQSGTSFHHHSFKLLKEVKLLRPVTNAQKRLKGIAAPLHWDDSSLKSLLSAKFRKLPDKSLSSSSSIFRNSDLPSEFKYIPVLSHSFGESVKSTKSAGQQSTRSILLPILPSPSLTATFGSLSNAFDALYTVKTADDLHKLLQKSPFAQQLTHLNFTLDGYASGNVQNWFNWFCMRIHLNNRFSLYYGSLAYSMVCKIESSQTFKECISVAALSITCALRTLISFENDVVADDVARVIAGKNRLQLDTRSLCSMFRACRVPGLQVDEVHVYDYMKSSHVLVLYRGIACTIDVLNEELQPFPMEELVKGFLACVCMIDHELSSPFPNHMCVAGLTSLKREKWCSLRAKIIGAVESRGSEFIQLAESAICAVCLDPTPDFSEGEYSYLLCRHHNRWYDKSLQFVCTPEFVGVITERSLVDSTALTVLVTNLRAQLEQITREQGCSSSKLEGEFTLTDHKYLEEATCVAFAEKYTPADRQRRPSLAVVSDILAMSRRPKGPPKEPDTPADDKKKKSTDRRKSVFAAKKQSKDDRDLIKEEEKEEVSVIPPSEVEEYVDPSVRLAMKTPVLLLFADDKGDIPILSPVGPTKTTPLPSSRSQLAQSSQEIAPPSSLSSICHDTIKRELRDQHDMYFDYSDNEEGTFSAMAKCSVRKPHEKAALAVLAAQIAYTKMFNEVPIHHHMAPWGHYVGGNGDIPVMVNCLSAADLIRKILSVQSTFPSCGAPSDFYPCPIGSVGNDAADKSIWFKLVKEIAPLIKTALGDIASILLEAENGTSSMAHFLTLSLLHKGTKPPNISVELPPLFEESFDDILSPNSERLQSPMSYRSFVSGASSAQSPARSTLKATGFKHPYIRTLMTPTLTTSVDFVSNSLCIASPPIPRQVPNVFLTEIETGAGARRQQREWLAHVAFAAAGGRLAAGATVRRCGTRSNSGGGAQTVLAASATKTARDLLCLLYYDRVHAGAV